MNAPSLKARLASMRYSAYSYSYPHKTAYRALAQPVPLHEAWAPEKRDALFLYIHVPFCEMRCGFCNLFTLAQPEQALMRRYVDQVLRQMEVVAAQLGDWRIARFALGGGTPTFLDMESLQRLLDGAATHLGLDLGMTPASVEVSPETATPDKLALLKQAGVDRVSMGIQSFFQEETTTLIRRQENRTVATALQSIRDAGIDVLNMDLIYGIAGQTVESFQASIACALAWRPEEIYLYPLYVRPLTGLGLVQERGRDSTRVFSRHQEDHQHRETLYRAGRDALLEAGYEQVSMRMFRLPQPSGKPGPVYCCQQDGMIGLGCGARSYTRTLHYSSEYAVGRQSTRDIISRYCEQAADAFATAHYGIWLDEDERKRRFVIQSLLTHPGLDLKAYAEAFNGSEALADIPLLPALVGEGLADHAGDRVVLNAEGLALSDGIGPALISPTVGQRMQAFEVL